MHKNHEPVRVGIAGLGRSGWGIHGDACESLAPRYQVVAVSDPRPERRAEAEQRFGCRSYAEAEDLIADRSYNREQLEWHEESWRRPEGGRELTVHPFYEDLYRTLREGAPLAVTPESVRRQIAVLETCHTSCPL